MALITATDLISLALPPGRDSKSYSLTNLTAARRCHPDAPIRAPVTRPRLLVDGGASAGRVTTGAAMISLTFTRTLGPVPDR